MPKARSPRPGDPTEAAPQPNALALAFAAADPPPPTLDGIDAVVAASSASTRDLNAALREALAPDLDRLDRKRATTVRRNRARRAANAKRGKAETAALDAIASSLGHDPLDPQPWKPSTSTGDAASVTFLGQPETVVAVCGNAGEGGSLGGGTIPPPPPLDSELPREGGRGSKRGRRVPVDLTTPPSLPPAPTDMTYAAPMRRRLRAVCCLRLLGKRSWVKTMRASAAEAEAVLYARDAPAWARECWRAWRADLRQMRWAGTWACPRRDGVGAPVSDMTIRRHLRRWPAPAAS